MDLLILDVHYHLRSVFLLLPALNSSVVNDSNLTHPLRCAKCHRELQFGKESQDNDATQFLLCRK